MLGGAQAVEFSARPPPDGEFDCSLKRKLRNGPCGKLYFKLALKWMRKHLFKSILTRIERVDFSKRVIDAG
jgi:hypothetical protein